MFGRETGLTLRTVVEVWLLETVSFLEKYC